MSRTPSSKYIEPDLLLRITESRHFSSLTHVMFSFLFLALVTGRGRGFQSQPFNEMTGGEMKLGEKPASRINPKLNPTFENYKNSDPNATNFLSVEQAVGFSNQGHLVNATLLPLQGLGFVAAFNARDKQYSTFELQKVIEYATKKMTVKFLNVAPALIGNLSREHGGPVGDHLSHQNGTDGDIFFYKKTFSDVNPSMIVNGKISKNFDVEKNYFFIKYLAETEQVSRIFIDKVLMQSMCTYAALNNDLNNNSALKKLRHWAGHTAHLHVRIYCPMNSPNCHEQLDTASPMGCDLITMKNKVL